MGNYIKGGDKDDDSYKHFDHRWYRLASHNNAGLFSDLCKACTYSGSFNYISMCVISVHSVKGRASVVIVWLQGLLASPILMVSVVIHNGVRNYM